MNNRVCLSALLNRLRVCLSVAALTPLLATASPSPYQTLLFDFGAANTTANAPAPGDPLYYWNNVGTTVGLSNSGQLLDLVTTDNTATSVGLVMISRFNGVNENGTTVSTLFPINATRDSMYGNTEAFNSLANIFPSFKLTGLDVGMSYDFTFYASRTNAVDNRETGYTLTGANAGFTALNAANNVDSFATANGIIPNAQGEITVAIAPTANNVNAFHFTYLGVMQVVAIPEPGSLALMLGGGFLILALLRRRIS